MITKKLHDLLAAQLTPVIFELGVYDGKNTHQLIMCCDSGNPKMYAFEPDPRNVEQCAAALPETVNFYPAAIGNVTGQVPFHLSSPDPEGATASSSLSPFRDHIKVFDWCHDAGTVEVPCWRLDDFCLKYKIDHIDLIYMDVQGAERMVIEGAQKILKHTKYIFTEFEGVSLKDEGTLYEHSSSLERILSLLPGWTALEVLPGDALLKNENLCVSRYCC